MVTEDASKISDAEFLQAFHKGKEHFDNNRLDEARVFLEKAYKIKPADEKVLNLLGMVYFKLNYLPEAEEIYSQLIATNTNIYVLHSNLGLIRLKLGRLKESEVSLKKALDLQPHNPKAQVYMGLLYEKAGDYPKALYYFEKGGAQKLVEQLQDKMATLKKEEILEEADIVEVREKQPLIIQEELQEEKKVDTQSKEKEETNIFAEEKKDDQEEPLPSEEKKDELFKYFAPEAKSDSSTEEAVEEESSQSISVSKMAQELGLEVTPPLVIEPSSEEYITEEPQEEKKAETTLNEQEEVLILEETPAEKMVESAFKEDSFIKSEYSPAPQSITHETTVEIQDTVPTAEAQEITREDKPAAKEPEIIIIEKEPVPEKNSSMEETAEIKKSSIMPLPIKKKIELPEEIPVKTPEIITPTIAVTPPQMEIQKEQPARVFIPEIPLTRPLSLDFFSRDRFYLQPLTGADRFLLVDPHLLEIILSEEIIIRKGTMSSFCGDIKFDFRKLEEINTPLIQCQGAGVIFLSHERTEIFLFSLNNEEVNIEESHFLVAQGSLKIEGKHLEDTISYLTIKGTGTLGISIKSHPLTLNVLSSMPVNIYSDALIAWSGNINAQIILESEIKGIMTCFEENAIPLKFKGIGDVVVEQGCLWGDRRTK